MIQIIGAGAIGCLWLAKFLQININCHIVTRKPTLAKQLIFTDLQGITHHFPINIGTALLPRNKSEQTSAILVCVKAQHVLEALLAQQAYISPEQVIILMHNGYGCAEQVVKYFPNNLIVSATTANASLVNGSFNISHTGHGDTFLGAGSYEAKQVDSITKLFQSAMQDVYWENDINSICWKKLVINAVINPLTAINQIKNGELRDKRFTPIISDLLDEIYKVTQAELLDFTSDELYQSVISVINATADNLSSMNRDIFHQRTTEIEFINGYLIAQAKRHKINTPLLIKHYQQIKELESRSLTPVNKL